MAVASLKNVAEFSGVSIATVSQVLNNRGNKSNIRVSEATRRKVMSVARKLNYQINVLARNLRTQSSNTIGIIAPSILWTDVLQARIADTARRAHREGFDLMMYYRWPQEQAYENAVRSLRSAQVAAMIVSDMSEQTLPDSLRDWFEEDRPILFLGYFCEGSFNTIDTDRKEGFRLAVEHLVRLGHRELAIVLPEVKDDGMPNSTYRSRLDGFRKGLSEAGLSFRPEQVFTYSLSNDKSIARAMRHLAKASPRPTGLLTYSDETAALCLRELVCQGLSVPRDISIVGFDGSRFSRTNLIPITTVVQPVEELSKQTVRKLVEMVRGKSPKRFASILCPPKLIVRKTTAPPPTGGNKR